MEGTQFYVLSDRVAVSIYKSSDCKLVAGVLRSVQLVEKVIIRVESKTLRYNLLQNKFP